MRQKTIGKKIRVDKTANSPYGSFIISTKYTGRQTFTSPGKNGWLELKLNANEVYDFIGACKQVLRDNL